MKSSELLGRITTNPSICHGKPCIRGLRYPVDMILELLSAGMTEQEILADYDDLEVPPRTFWPFLPSQLAWSSDELRLPGRCSMRPAVETTLTAC